MKHVFELEKGFARTYKCNNCNLYKFEINKFEACYYTEEVRVPNNYSNQTTCAEIIMESILK